MSSCSTQRRWQRSRASGKPTTEALDISSDDRWVATAGSDGFVRVWEITTSRLLFEIPVSDEAVNNVRFLEGDRRLLVTTQRSLRMTVLSLSTEDQVSGARRAVTRTFTPTECVTYKIDPCPSLEELRSG